MAGTRPDAIAPITVPMKNGTMREENANAAPNSRCQRSAWTSLRNAKPAPRSTIPNAASHSGSAAAEVRPSQRRVQGQPGQQDPPDHVDDHAGSRCSAGGPYGTPASGSACVP